MCANPKKHNNIKVTENCKQENQGLLKEKSKLLKKMGQGEGYLTDQIECENIWNEC